MLEHCFESRCKRSEFIVVKAANRPLQCLNRAAAGGFQQSPTAGGNEDAHGALIGIAAHALDPVTFRQILQDMADGGSLHSKSFRQFRRWNARFIAYKSQGTVHDNRGTSELFQFPIERAHPIDQGAGSQ